MIDIMKGKTYEESLGLHCLKLWTLEDRRNRQDLIEVYKMCNGLSRLNLNELFTLDENIKGTRGHSWKLAKFRRTRDCCKYFFSNRVIIGGSVLKMVLDKDVETTVHKQEVICRTAI